LRLPRRVWSLLPLLASAALAIAACGDDGAGNDQA